VRDPSDVLISPVVSEKSYALSEKSSYVFNVSSDATKPEVRRAVEKMFSVKVVRVNTLNRKGKAKRNRRTNVAGRKPDRKRAIVTLAANDKIDLFQKS
jgi:large subunit ribosomal protein L23